MSRSRGRIRYDSETFIDTVVPKESPSILEAVSSGITMSSPMVSQGISTFLENIPALPSHHVVSVDMFTKEHLAQLFKLAKEFKTALGGKEQRAQRDKPMELLRGKIMGSIFYEASTRTSSSFAAAMMK